MLIDLEAPQSLLDRLARDGIASPAAADRDGAHPTLLIGAASLELVTTTVEVDPVDLEALGSAAWEWYWSICRDQPRPGRVVAQLRDGTRRSTRFRPTARASDIERVVSTLLDADRAIGSGDPW